MSLHVLEARQRLLRAVLRCLEADLADESADADAQSEYAYEELALAARDLTQATEALPADRRPVGWSR